jgi:hypothetical protein
VVLQGSPVILYLLTTHELTTHLHGPLALAATAGRVFGQKPH